jgi:integrase
VELVPGWPPQSLGAEYHSDRTYALEWSAFQTSYPEDVGAFVRRSTAVESEADWLDAEDDRRPLRPRTQSNYSEALRRAASILVKLGVDPNSIRLIRDVVEPSRVKRILHFLKDRTGRKSGGHVGYMALVLYLAAVDRGGLTDKQIEILGGFVAKTKERRLQMSERTEQRLAQFEDPLVLERFKHLPAILVDRAEKLPVGIASAKAVRMALLIALAFDTGLRSGNIVALDLDRHVLGDIDSGKGKVFVVVPGEEIKNGVECRARLRAGTVKLLRLYRDKYRIIHVAKPCSWLFPVGNGNHMMQQRFYGDLKDLGDKELGLDLTPHLVRALIAKIILNQYPGGMPIVQQMLGHTNLATPTAYYAALRQQDAADIYHDILEGRADASDQDLI